MSCSKALVSRAGAAGTALMPTATHTKADNRLKRAIQNETSRIEFYEAFLTYDFWPLGRRIPWGLKVRKSSQNKNGSG